MPADDGFAAQGNDRKRKALIISAIGICLLMVGYASGSAPQEVYKFKNRLKRSFESSEEMAARKARKYERQAGEMKETPKAKYERAERRAIEQATPELSKTTTVGEVPQWTELFENNVDLTSDFNRRD